MGTILSKGYKKPSTGDRNFWTDLESNITRVNGHTHDGSNSEKLNPKYFTRDTSVISSASWGSIDSNDNYKQTITLPSSVTFETSIMTVKDSSTGEDIHPDIVKVSTTTFDIFVNDNTLDLVVYYG